MRVWLSAIGLALAACSVNVPGQGDRVYFCASNVDCNSDAGYTCEGGQCVYSGNGVPITEHCGKSSDCHGTAPICVSHANTAGDCHQGCSSPGASCTDGTTPGVCVNVFYSGTTNATGGSACVAPQCSQSCGTGMVCGPVNPSQQVAIESAFACINATEASGCARAGCPTNQVCVSLNQPLNNATSMCASSCDVGNQTCHNADPTDSSACVVTSGYAQGGAPLNQNACKRCLNTCGGGQACLAPSGPVNPYDQSPVQCATPTSSCQCDAAHACVNNACTMCPMGACPTNFHCAVSMSTGTATLACVSDWAELNGSATTQGISGGFGGAMTPTIGIGGGGDVVVAWAASQSGASSHDIYAQRYTASQSNALWQPLGPSTSSGGVSSSAADSTRPRVALDSQGNLDLAWVENGNILMLHYLPSSGSWVGANGAVGAPTVRSCGGTCYAPVLTVNPNAAAAGSTWVGWIDSVAVSGNIAQYNAGATRMFWDGAGFRTVIDAGPVTAFLDGVPTLAMAADIPLGVPSSPFMPTYVVWQALLGGEPTLFGKRIDVQSSTPPSPLGGSSGQVTAGPATGPALVVISRSPRSIPVVAWHAGSAGVGDVHVLAYDSANNLWQPLGTGSTEIVSAGFVQPSSVGLAVGADGMPVVIWQAQVSGNLSQVYARKWNGTAWVGLSGSDVGSGLSNSTRNGGVADPTLAIGPNAAPSNFYPSAAELICVTWTDLVGTTGSSSIYVRCRPNAL